MALEARRAAHIHLPEDSLEDYAFGRLPHAELADFEEHILVCEHCQERLSAEDNFAEDILTLTRMEPTAAVRAFPASSAQNGRAPRASLGLTAISPVSLFRGFPNWNRRVSKFWRAPAWAAGLVGLLAVGFGILSWRPPVMPTSEQMANAVTLKTLRGGSSDGMADARPNRPLNLSIDSREMATSTAELGPYRLEVVDAAGNRAWTGTAVSSVSGKIVARVEKRLAAGVYWVRLYAHSGKLLREYGLRLG